jgi:hypothetical protein
VIDAVLRAAPSGVPLVFLSPTRSRSADWSPFIVALSGFKLRRPIRSLPITVQASDLDWEGAAHELIDRATRIVLDGSDRSRAIETEITLIAGRRPGATTVLLLERSPLAGGGTRDITNWPGTTITYERTWRRALLRLGFGSVILTFTVGGVLSPLVPGVLDDLSVLLQPQVIATCWWMMVPLLAAAVWAYCILFVRPAVDRGAHRALVAALRHKPGA